MNLRRLKKHLREKSLREATAVGAASGGVQQATTVGSSTTGAGTNTAANATSAAQQTQQQQQDDQTNLQKNATDQDLKIKMAFTKDDVDKMTPGEIINYVYVSTPTNLDPETKQALLNRADQLRSDAQAQKDVKERAKQILRSVGSTIDIGV